MPTIASPRRRRRGPAARLATLAAAFTVAALGFAAPSAHAADTLISQGKPVTVSSVENAGTPASAAVDGNTATRWSSQFSDPQWIQVDLGGPATVGQVKLNWEAAYATAFQIQVSDNGSSWSTVYQTTTGTGGAQTLNVSGSGRYVRLYTTAGHALRRLAVGVPGLRHRRRHHPDGAGHPARLLLG